MAKAAKMTPAQLLEKLKGSLNEDQMAAARRLSGQDAQGGGKSTPKVVINHFGLADPNGNKNPKGNFVLDQKGSFDAATGKKELIRAGIDLGANPEMTILKVGTQFSYFGSADDRCSSQICTERNEKAIGSHFREACSSGKCPKRKDGTGKQGKGKACSQQYVVFIELPEGTKNHEGEEVKHAIFYGKGVNYKPFQEYLEKELKPSTDGLGYFAMKTVFGAEDMDGYFRVSCEVGDANVYTYMDLLDAATAVDKDLIEFKAQNAVAPREQKALPAPEVEDPFAGADMGAKTPEVVSGSLDDEIPF